MAFDANDLSPHEHFVVERARAGDWADFSTMAPSDAGRPSIRAGFLRKLLLELDATWTVRGPGVRVRGARIDGALDLTDCSGAPLPALSLEGCEIADLIDISRARLTRLSLEGSSFSGLTGADARIDGDVSFARTTPAGAPGAETLRVDLRGARIGGDVRLSGAKAAAETGGPALRFDGAEIGGDLLFDESFEAFGAVHLANAHVGGALAAEGAQFLNRSDDAKSVALAARGAVIDGDVRLARVRIEGEADLTGARIGGDVDLAQALLRNENGVALRLANARVAGQVAGAAKIGGVVTLQGAEIARNLDLRGAEMGNPIAGRGNAFGMAVDGASLSVGGAALLQGANIKGELFLADARIAGYLGFGGGRFINGGGWAIRAPNVRVGGNLTLKVSADFAPHGQKTVIEGGAMFDRAQIDGSLTWSNVELRGPGPEDEAKGGVFSIEDASIRGALHAKGFVAQSGARIDLSGATCAALEDDPANGWGAESVEIDAEGFAYGRFENGNESWRTRLSWLKRTRRHGGAFSPQPYTQAAQTYARAGRREDARRIQLAQADQRTLKASSGPFTWALSSLFGLVAGYGLAPIRVLRALVLFIALGIGGVLAMNAQGALVTADGRACNGAVEPTLYAVDVALPIVDLGQASRCAPGRTARAELSAGMPLGESDWRLFEGAALWKWAHAFYAILGAILAALAVITFSGVLKPRD